MMMSSVMPDQETGAVGRIPIRAEFWSVLEMSAQLLLMSNNLMKMDKSRTLFIASAVAAKVSGFTGQDLTQNDPQMTQCEPFFQVRLQNQSKLEKNIFALGIIAMI